jgi:uncharacterized protein (TIGR03083 family)
MIRFDAIARLKDDMAHFQRLLLEGDVDAPVPGCPGWDLGALAGHLGGVYRFAATAMETGKDSEVPSGPTGRAEIEMWFAESGDRLLQVFSRRDEQDPCWTMAPPNNVGFWTRRMAHETALHLWDGESSQGRAPMRIAPEIAADGVHEVVTMFFPRQVRLGRTRPLSDVVQFQIADVPVEENLVLAGDGSSFYEGPSDATIWGRAETILLLLWKRQTLAGSPVRILGDVDAAQRVLSSAVTP